jgi:molecular chaperone GrpE
MDDPQQQAGQTGDGDAREELKKKLEAAQKREADETKQHQEEDLKKLETELESLKSAATESERKALRALADLHNAGKRMEEEKAMFAAFAGQNLILELLEIYDNYHRLLEHRPADLPKDEWHKGLELIDQQFQKFLETQGVKRLETQVGDHIDPQKHQAVMSGEGEEGIILDIFSHGYEMRGRVIRTAKVKVGKAKAA